MAVPKRAPASNRRALLLLARLLGALLLAGLATYSLRSRHLPVDSILFLGGAAALFLWAMHGPEEVEGPLSPLPAASA